MFSNLHHCMSITANHIAGVYRCIKCECGGFGRTVQPWSVCMFVFVSFNVWVRVGTCALLSCLCLISCNWVCVELLWWICMFVCVSRLCLCLCSQSSVCLILLPSAGATGRAPVGRPAVARAAPTATWRAWSLVRGAARTRTAPTARWDLRSPKPAASAASPSSRAETVWAARVRRAAPGAPAQVAHRHDRCVLCINY